VIKNFLHNTSGDNIPLRVATFGLLLIMLIINLFTGVEVYMALNEGYSIDRSTIVLIICDVAISIACVVGTVCINYIAKNMKD